ncbi:MAG: histidine phosphatase family protein [Planctomycetota bacterium]|nr:MAG: histidine phosphatase family protein [Planctomycetota bacterium]
MHILELHIIRHGQSQGNATGDYSTMAHDALSERGLRQADELAQYLTKLHIDHVVVSPMQRTLQTIAPYLEMQDRRAEIWPEVCEISGPGMGAPVGDHWNPIAADTYPGLPPRFDFYQGKAFRAIEGEPLSEGMYRVHIATQRLMSLAQDQDCSVAVVSHGFYLRGLLNYLFAPQKPVKYHAVNCGLSTIKYQNGQWEVRCINAPTCRA